MKIPSNQLTLRKKPKSNLVGKMIQQSPIFVDLMTLAIGLSVVLFYWSLNPIAFSQLSSPVLNSSSKNALMISISNPTKIIHELVGKYITISGNLNYLRSDKTLDNSTKDGIAYISIVDVKDKIPVDRRLECRKRTLHSVNQPGSITSFRMERETCQSRFIYNFSSI